jgi:AraC family transcriptional regulator of adaptative response/methylated-DNA-[protein]-cysteine methyltransferase
MLCYTQIESPVGTLVAGATGRGLCLLSFDNNDDLQLKMKKIEQIAGNTFIQKELPYFQLLREQLSDYFEGTRKEFSVPLHLIGSSFQLSVWEALQQIPFGETRKYKTAPGSADQSAELFDVIEATRENPVQIVIPGHRIIKDPQQMEYENLAIKNSWLLNHELKMNERKNKSEYSFYGFPGMTSFNLKGFSFFI